MKIQPSTAIPLKIGHVMQGIKGISGKKEIETFEKKFADFIGSRHAVAFGNGTTAFFAVLMAMKEDMEGKDEVVLPAYTVPTLTLAFKKAGLRTILCDVDKNTFNMDFESMKSVCSEKTLAVIPVHMFGFPCTMDEVNKYCKDKGIFVIEDACQAPGAFLNGKRIGTIGDAGIFSLCKGKNISTFHGGLVTTDNDELAFKVRAIKQILPPRSFTYRMSMPFILTAFSFAMRPWFYGLFYKAISGFKSTEVHTRFHPTVYNSFMAGVAESQLSVLDEWNSLRRKIGREIRKGIEKSGLLMPLEIESSEPVYNHLPVVFESEEILEKVQKKLWENGIDTGRMYQKPINHIYPELEYVNTPEPFPAAAYIAPRLLTIPTHPYISKEDIGKIINILNENK